MKESLRRCVLLILLLFGQGLTRPGLAQEAERNVSKANQDKAARLSMIVEAKTREGVFILEPRETLHSGDRLALRIEVDRPAYVYVLGTDRSGRAEHLFPDRGHTRLQPGGAHRVPLIPDWIVLDTSIGHENLFVIASLSPLARAQLLHRVQDSRGGVTTSKPAPRSAPDGRPDTVPPALLTDVQYRSLGNRGIVRGLAIEKGTGAELGADRSAMIHFSFQHQ